MSSRRAKKLKNWLLPLTFILGIVCFPLGSMLMGQAKKAHHALTKPHHQSPKQNPKAHKSMSKHKKAGKSKHKKTTHQRSGKSHKKVARAH